MPSHTRNAVHSSAEPRHHPRLPLQAAIRTAGLRLSEETLSLHNRAALRHRHPPLSVETARSHRGGSLRGNAPLRGVPLSFQSLCKPLHLLHRRFHAAAVALRVAGLVCLAVFTDRCGRELVCRVSSSEEGNGLPLPTQLLEQVQQRPNDLPTQPARRRPPPCLSPSLHSRPVPAPARCVDPLPRLHSRHPSLRTPAHLRSGTERG